MSADKLIKPITNEIAYMFSTYVLTTKLLLLVFAKKNLTYNFIITKSKGYHK